MRVDIGGNGAAKVRTEWWAAGVRSRRCQEEALLFWGLNVGKEKRRKDGPQESNTRAIEGNKGICMKRKEARVCVRMRRVDVISSEKKREKMEKVH